MRGLAMGNEEESSVRGNQREDLPDDSASGSLDDSASRQPDDLPWVEPEPPRKYEKRRPRVGLYILIFIVFENLVIPPRYQVSDNLALGVIWVYQHTASELFKETGMVRCRFYPTCSEYTRLALLHYGFFKGIVMGTWHILRCNPFYQGPVEEWPYEGAWDDCRQLPQKYLEVPEDVHLPPFAKEE